jgi:cysteine desulfurase
VLAGWELNGAESSRWRGNLNLRLAGLDAARIRSHRPSHVLKALGLSDAEARSSIRLGFGRYTTSEEIDSATTLIAESARRQKALAA